jgi:epoxyqueuosine reductase
MITDNSLYYKILLNLAGFGAKARAVSASRIGELADEIEENHEAGRLDESLYREWLCDFDRTAPSFARSVVVVASPRPALSASFEWKGERLEVVVPPTYVHDSDDEAERCMSAIIAPQGYRVERGNPPLKLLATRSGLARYGRNNITYIDGMGSYYRLCAFYTDAQLREEYWGESRMLERCRRCTACATMCPTGAIGRDRFLLHAEKCLTFHNERNAPFPEWMDDNWHHCLIGCLFCQKFCPQDRSFARWIDPVATFSAEETRRILDAVPIQRLEKSTRDKIERLNMLKDYGLLARNLGAVIANQVDRIPSAPAADLG